MSSNQLQFVNRCTRSTPWLTVNQYRVNVLSSFSTIFNSFFVNRRFNLIFCWSSQFVSLSFSIGVIFFTIFSTLKLSLSIKFMPVLLAFVLNWWLRLFPTFNKWSSFEKSLSTVRWFLVNFPIHQYVILKEQLLLFSHFHQQIRILDHTWF